MKNMAWNFFILSNVNVKFDFMIARYILVGFAEQKRKKERKKRGDEKEVGIGTYPKWRKERKKKKKISIRRNAFYKSRQFTIRKEIPAFATYHCKTIHFRFSRLFVSLI